MVSGPIADNLGEQLGGSGIVCTAWLSMGGGLEVLLGINE